MTDPFAHTVALALDNPVFGVSLTVAAYAVALEVHRRLGGIALLHPVIVAAALVGLLLVATDTDYDRYFAQAYPLHVALGAFVVLLAVPLWRHAELIRTSGGPLALALLAGAAVALATALAWPLVSGASRDLLATLAPKSATTAVALQISETMGGVPGVTALLVIATGVFGAAFGPPILTALRVTDERAVGFALGVASHAVGTARAFQISSACGAFATIGMILHACLMAALAPALLFLP